MQFRLLWPVAMLVLLGGASKQEMPPIGAVPGSVVTVEYSDPSYFEDGQASAPLEVGATGTPASYVGWQGYRVKVRFTNKSEGVVLIRPIFFLYDSNKTVVGSANLRLFVIEATRISGAPLPPSFTVPNSGYTRTFGTLNDPSTGRSYNYSGYSGTPPSFGSGFAQGYAAGQAIRAARQRREASTALSWAGSSWVKDEYEIPPGVTVTGELFFASAATERVSRKTTPEPIILEVNFWNESYRRFLPAEAVVQMPPLGR